MYLEKTRPRSREWVSQMLARDYADPSKSRRSGVAESRRKLGVKHRPCRRDHRSRRGLPALIAYLVRMRRVATRLFFSQSVSVWTATVQRQRA